MTLKAFEVPGGQTLVVPDSKQPGRATRRSYSAKYKAAILAEYDGLDKAGKGALLRREGLYTSLIDAWRKQRDRGGLKALEAHAGRPAKDPRDRELERLRVENERLARKLDTAQRVIEVQGKLSALLEGLAAEGANETSEPPTRRPR
jgi:transposase-like protein